MSVLAHVVLRLGRSEPAVTQALAHILQEWPDLAKAFVKLANFTFELGHIESEIGTDDRGIPDLTIHDAAANIRILVENKFWAGLTDHQPVDYLRQLPDDINCSLLFIVPDRRIDTIWRVLKDRCHDESVGLGPVDIHAIAKHGLTP